MAKYYAKNIIRSKVNTTTFIIIIFVRIIKLMSDRADQG